MKKPIKSYSEAVKHNHQNLTITINIFKEPCVRNDDHEFYTHIDITEENGKRWGQLFLPDPVEDIDFPQAIEDVKNHIDIYKTRYNEFDKQRFSEN